MICIKMYSHRSLIIEYSIFCRGSIIYSCNMLYYCLEISAGMNVHFPHSNYNKISYVAKVRIVHCIHIHMHYIACISIASYILHM